MKLFKKITAAAMSAAIALSSSGGVFIAEAPAVNAIVDDCNDDWLHAKGSRLYDMYDNEVWLTGVNWFGFNCGERFPHGLWNVEIDQMLSSIADHGINTIRFPIATELILDWMDGVDDSEKIKSGINPKNSGGSSFNSAFFNPDGGVMTSHEVFDTILEKCKQYGIKVFIDIHSPTLNNSGHNYNLWYYTPNIDTADNMAITESGVKVTSKIWKDSLVWLADQYKDNDTLIAYDLKNEPHGRCSEGVGSAKWDGSADENNWAWAATDCALAMLDKNPNALILIEGVEQYPREGHEWGDTDSRIDPPAYDGWWGAQLRGVREYPIDLGKYQDKLVYSPHDYGPSVYAQTWFDKDFTEQTLLDDYWYDTWAFINEEDIAPLLIGEWGGFMDGGVNQKWMELLRDYMVNHHINHTFWCLNPNSGDTGGLVGYDFKTWDEEKYALLEKSLWQTKSGKYISLDHQTALGNNGISLNDFYSYYSASEGSNLDGGKTSDIKPVEDPTNAVTTTKAPATTTTPTTTTKATTNANTPTTTTKAPTTTQPPASDPTKFREFEFGADNWGFANRDMYSTQGYYINDEHKALLYSKLSHTDAASVSKLLDNKWRGSCYGLAVTSILNCYDIIKPGELMAGANSLNAIDLPNSYIRSVVNYYYAMQVTDYVYQQTNCALLEMTEIEKLTNLNKCLADKSPTLLTFFYPGGGHAVVAYDIEKGSWTYNGNTYTARALIYDNNSTVFSKENCLYFNMDEETWYIPRYKANSENEGQLGIITDDLNYINYNGMSSGSKPTYNGTFYATFDSAPLSTNFDVRKVLNDADDDSPIYNAAGANDFVIYHPLGADEEASRWNAAVRDSDVGYSLLLDKPERVDMSFTFKNSLLSVNASSAADVTFDPEGLASFSGNSSAFKLSLVFNEGAYPTDWYTFTASGSGAVNASLKKADGGYILSGSNLKDIILTGGNDDVLARRYLSTEYKEVFLYEIDENTIGVAVDKDGNGTFETKLPAEKSVMAGDANCDGVISIADVTAILQSIGNPDKYGLSGQAYLNADVDGTDGLSGMDALTVQRVDAKISKASDLPIRK